MTELFAELFKFSVAVGVLAFVGRSVFTHILDRDVANFKSRLEAENSREIEKFKVDLRAAAYEREVVFSGLHAKRIEIIAGLYERLFKARDILQDVTSLIQAGGKDDLVKRISKTPTVVHDLFYYFGANRVWFGEPLCELMDRLRGTVWDVWRPFITVHDPETLPDAKSREVARDIFEKQVPPISDALERQIREMLGISGTSVESKFTVK
jgi:hypothetical protein